jgi:hypothetical protein
VVLQRRGTRATTPPAPATTPDERRRRLAPAILVVVALIAAGLWCYGLGAGGTFYFKVAQAPLRPALAAPYYRESLLHVGLAHLLGFAGSITAFRLFVLSGLWAAQFWLAVVVRRRLSLGHTALVLLVLAFHPVAMIAHAWTCHPDAITVLLTALLMFTRRPWLAAALAALGAWNHLPMWLVLCAQTTLLWLGFAEPQAKRRALAVGLGFVVGALACKATLWLSGVHLAADRVALATSQSASVLAGYWTDAGWPVLYSLHFAHLLWLPALLVGPWSLPRRPALAVLASQLLALAAAFVTQDTTRVFACLAWGSLVYGLVHALARGERDLPQRRGLARLVGLAVVLTIAGPKIFAWKGAVHDTTAARQHLRGLLFRAAYRNVAM